MKFKKEINDVVDEGLSYLDKKNTKNNITSKIKK